MEAYGWLFWLAAMVVFGIAEAATVNLVSIWFVGGALCAMVAQLLGGSLWLQITVFLVVSGILLACLRSFVRKFVLPRHTATNSDMALGREAYLTETADNLLETGALKLDGKVWTVRSVSGEVIPAGTLVKIVKLEGVKLYVEPTAVPAGR